MLSQPSGWDTVCSAVESLVLSVVFEVLLLAMDPFFTRFLADTGVELALRLTPEAGEFVLPLVAGDMRENSQVVGSEGRGCQGINEVQSRD
jgi:hypothetical protein